MLFGVLIVDGLEDVEFIRLTLSMIPPNTKIG